MQQLRSFAGIFCLALSIVVVSAYNYRPLGSFPMPNAAFIHPARLGPQQNLSLLISAFNGNPLASDNIFIVPSFDPLNNFTQITGKVVSTAVTWPNTFTAADYSWFNQSVLSLGGGFLVPGKSTGAVSLFVFDENLKASGPFKISTDKSEWFYHRTLWRDVNNDGNVDIITARAIKPLIFGNPKGELIWLENPGPKKMFSGAWKEHHIADGPDIFFQMYDVDGDGVEEIFAAEFFSQKLVCYYTSGSWADSNSVSSFTIDSSMGPLFDLSWVDLNNDGKLDLLVTNHLGVTNQSAVFAFETPAQPKSQPWTRHTLQFGFQTRESGFAQASPGNAFAFWPRPSERNSTKPVIVLSGDGSQWAYLLEPQSFTDSNNWDYNLDVVLKTQATIGQVIADDFDNDGWSDFLVAVYDTGLVYGYTYSPSQ